ncbi:MAG: DUF4864 domain-containing protein [Rhodobacteraceae bacterium]|nr:MAG: DUF4864 domain-containing protein [Paracoccaceae bacterium]
MSQFFARLALLLTLSTPVPALADPIQRVINDQLSAFLADDFDTAFTYASPNIKRLFGSPERFGQMVRNGYPMVHRPEEVTMLEQREIDGRVVQRVMIRDMGGRVHMLAYQMIKTDDGWQINGVQILRAPEVGA